MAAVFYLVVSVGCVAVLKELNALLTSPYMDEPFHIPQALAYCKGHYGSWDPNITTPPGLYVMSLIFKRIFMLQCTIPVLRFTVLLSLLALPLALTRLLCSYRRVHPPSSLLHPLPEAVILSTFPIAWFFGFLYYTDVPSVLFVVLTATAAFEQNHWSAALVRGPASSSSYTNIIWIFYAYGSSQLMYLHYRHSTKEASEPATLHDPPALSATPYDLLLAVRSLPSILLDILPSLIPYTFVVAAFGTFVVWNGGIVLGDKANHVPSFHITQLYYFFAFATAFGWPTLISGEDGVLGLTTSVVCRMFGTKLRTTLTILICLSMAGTVKLFTIHHPFLLSDNRHYTFYVWHRIYMFHPLVPYLLIPGYLACAWAWYLRAGRHQTLLQTLALPVFTLPALLPTPLLEPRYFLIPYIFLRLQIINVPFWSLVLEGVWYTVINVVTMGVFLYLPREGVGRFMW